MGALTLANVNTVRTRVPCQGNRDSIRSVWDKLLTNIRDDLVNVIIVHMFWLH